MDEREKARLISDWERSVIKLGEKIPKIEWSKMGEQDWSNMRKETMENEIQFQMRKARRGRPNK